MPAKAGIQSGIDSLEAPFLDPGFRRGDEFIFNKLLNHAMRGVEDLCARL